MLEILLSLALAQDPTAVYYQKVTNDIVQEMQREKEYQQYLQEDHEMYETLGQGYMHWLNSLGAIKWHPTGMSKKEGFSCAGLLKAYGIMRGIRTLQEAEKYNSSGLYSISKKKSITKTKPFDYVYFYRISGKNRYNHAAVATNTFDPQTGILSIIDNIEGEAKIREIQLHYSYGQRTYNVGHTKRSIHIAENPLFTLAKKNGLEYEPLERWIGKYNISRYYAPLSGQESYYLGSYEADKSMNCGPGDCLQPAYPGIRYTENKAGHYLACPPEIPFGTKIKISGYDTIVTCADRGGSIKGRRLDLWAGVGDEGLKNIKQNKLPAGPRDIYILGSYTSGPIKGK